MRGLMVNKINFFILIILLCTAKSYSDYTKTGSIETVRENGYVTVIFYIEPVKELYYIFSNDKVIGSISSFQKIPDTDGKRRYICRYSLLHEKYTQEFRPGLDIMSVDPDKEIDKRLKKNPYIESVIFKTDIITLIDQRSMVLVPAGKFVMGCSDCDDDEYPEQVEYTGDFYIDKFEVSNIDYRKYADIKGLAYPDYWKENLDSSRNFKDVYFSLLPVIVTYYEAKDYATWAGKRLPLEKEWEKAARGPISPEKSGTKGPVYSWGKYFRDGLANTEEFWISDTNGINLKKIITEKFSISVLPKGYIPVDLYENESLSYYGAAHLDGNALEWTDSWYQPYSGNRKVNKKYGNQYKVLRGGAYFLPKSESRITDRKTGGMPDLYKDRIAGFRCVKNTAESDKK